MTSSQANRVVPESFVQSAEFYDIMCEEEWNLRREAIASELITISGNAGPVIDIGSGTGRGVELIAKTLPTANIIAVEPSSIMRAGLMSRIMASKDLRERVSVFPCRMQELDMPDNLSAVLLIGCIGFMDKSARRQMWRALSEKLDANGLIIVDVMMIDKAQSVSNRQVACVQIGRYFYEVWMEGFPVDENTERWTVTYLVRDECTVLSSFKLSYGWLAFGLKQIESEASEMGFSFTHLSQTSLPIGVLRFSR